MATHHSSSKTYTKENPLHVHIENSRHMMPVFIVRPDQYEKALAAHPDVAERIRTTWGYDEDIYQEQMRTANAMITYRFPRARLRQDAKQLELLQVLGAGVDFLLPLDWVPEGITLLTNSGAHVPKSSQSALMAILMINAQIPALTWSQRRKEWNRTFTSSLDGKTLLIVGVGNIGTGAAEQAKRFGMKVLGIRRSGTPQPHVDAMHRPEDLHTLLPQADIVLLNTALTPQTHFLFGKREFDLMRKGAGLINMSRGGLIDPVALDLALRSGKLGGALIDVTYPEPPPPEWPYWDTPNLIITPHVLSDDIDAYVPRTLELFFNNLRHHFNGEPLTNVVDLSRSY